MMPRLLKTRYVQKCVFTCMKRVNAVPVNKQTLNAQYVNYLPTRSNYKYV